MMMTKRIRFASSLLLLAACFAVTGCGGGGVKVKGKVVKGGQPFTLSDKGVFVISFIPEDAKDTTTAIAATETKTDGTFEVKGPQGKGIPAGKYKVAVQAFDPYGGPQSKDVLSGQFAPHATKLVVEVGQGEVVVDVGGKP